VWYRGTGDQATRPTAKGPSSVRHERTVVTPQEADLRAYTVGQANRGTTGRSAAASCGSRREAFLGVVSFMPILSIVVPLQ